MKKREALESAIRAAVQRWVREEFQWGRADCLLSLADIILAARGYDPAAQFRGRYKTRIGAYRITRDFGGPAGALAAMAYECGWNEIDPARAKLGDLGTFANGPASGGVIRDSFLWIGRTETGFAGIPATQVDRAWRVK